MTIAIIRYVLIRHYPYLEDEVEIIDVFDEEKTALKIAEIYRENGIDIEIKEEVLGKYECSQKFWNEEIVKNVKLKVD